MAQNDSLKIESSFCRDVRTLVISKSVNFDSTKPYIVYTVLDENVLFDISNSILNFIKSWKNIPQFVVVGVPNRNRWDELQWSGKIENSPFFRFLNQEIYNLTIVKNASFKVLIGHSLSAGFAKENFMTNNNFNAVLAISPPLNKIRNETFLKYSDTCDKTNKLLYMCSSEQDLNMHKKYFKELTKEKRLTKKKWLELDYFKDLKIVSHQLIPIEGLKNGLMFILDDYLNLPEKFISVKSKNLIGVNSFENSFLKMKEIYGFCRDYDSNDFQIYVDYYLKKKMFSEATRLVDLFITFSQNDKFQLVDAYYLKGFVFEKQNQLENALEWYIKGFEILPEEVINKTDFESDVLRLKKKLNK